ncbi:hypothetical protein Tco_0425935 [Tanacetum coccineum]
MNTIETKDLERRKVDLENPSNKTNPNLYTLEITLRSKKLFLGNTLDLVRNEFGVSLVPEPPIITAVVATTVVVDTSSILVPRAGEEPVHASIFADSTSAGTPGLEQLALLLSPFFPSFVGYRKTLKGKCAMQANLLKERDAEIASLKAQLCHKRKLLRPSTAIVFRSGCVLLRTGEGSLGGFFVHEFRDRKKFEGKCAMQANLLKERDAEIASLKAQLCLKEAEATKAIRLRGQVAAVEAVEAAWVSELDGLKEQNVALEG